MSLTREIRHGASHLDPHGTRVSRVKPNAVGRVGSCQEVYEISRVGSARLSKISNLAGRVGSGQKLFKTRGSAQVGSRGSQNLAGQVGSGREISEFRGSSRVGSKAFQNSRVDSSRLKRFSKSLVRSGRVGSGQVTRPDQIRLVRFDLTLEKP